MSLPSCPACTSDHVFSKSGGRNNCREFHQQYRCDACYTHFDASPVADGWTYRNATQRATHE